MRFAHLPKRATLAEFDFDFEPSIDRKLIRDLAGCTFVAEGRPVLFLGQPGTGKLNRPGFLGGSIPWRRGWRHGIEEPFPEAVPS